MGGNHHPSCWTPCMAAPPPAWRCVVYRLGEGPAPRRKLIKTLQLNADGRADAPLLEGETLQAGRYRLVFGVAAYASGRGARCPEPRLPDEVPLTARRPALPRAAAGEPVELLHLPRQLEAPDPGQSSRGVCRQYTDRLASPRSPPCPRPGRDIPASQSPLWCGSHEACYSRGRWQSEPHGSVRLGLGQPAAALGPRHRMAIA